MKRRAFTLIELLIVVAIIGILAAIAVPNLMNAQMRAKVSRALSDMKSMATAQEMYKSDNGKYAPCASIPDRMILPLRCQRVFRLTTPLAYLTSLPSNIFPMATKPLADTTDTFDYYSNRCYGGMEAESYRETNGWENSPIGVYFRQCFGPFNLWFCSRGPTGQGNDENGDSLILHMPKNKDPRLTPMAYDATNGLVSYGYILHVQ